MLHRLHKITNGDSKEFLTNITEKYLEDACPDDLHELMDELGKIQKSVYGYQNEVLSLAGLGKEYDEVDAVVKHVCKIVHWVGEVLCAAMVNREEVHTLYSAQQLLFQSG